MLIKRTFLERLFSLTPWRSHREETEIERQRRKASGMQPSRPMHLLDEASDRKLLRALESKRDLHAQLVKPAPTNDYRAERLASTVFASPPPPPPRPMSLHSLATPTVRRSGMTERPVPVEPSRIECGCFPGYCRGGQMNSRGVLVNGLRCKEFGKHARARDYTVAEPIDIPVEAPAWWARDQFTDSEMEQANGCAPFVPTISGLTAEDVGFCRSDPPADSGSSDSSSSSGGGE